MTTKEKLDLLWKFLFLLVIAVAIFKFSDHPRHRMMKHKLGHDNQEMRVKIEKEIVNGDTSIVVEINGEKVDMENLKGLGKGMEWFSRDGKSIIIKLDDEDLNGDEEIRIFKKKIIIRDED